MTVPGESSWSVRGRALLLLGRLALAAVFLFAAYTKLRPIDYPAHVFPHAMSQLRLSLRYFSFAVDSYQMLPPRGVSFVAFSLPWLELGLGLLLLSGWRLRYVAIVSTGLLLAFFSVMLRAYAKGLEISCGCFDPAEQLGVKTLLRDGSLLALSLAVTIGAFLRRRLQGILAPPAREPQRAE
jgi:uncharacterized membrane protein YphA (DoxX/SURF4 family)